jgi:hypothetical protein
MACKRTFHSWYEMSQSKIICHLWLPTKLLTLFLDVAVVAWLQRPLVDEWEQLEITYPTVVHWITENQLQIHQPVEVKSINDMIRNQPLCRWQPSLFFWTENNDAVSSFCATDQERNVCTHTSHPTCYKNSPTSRLTLDIKYPGMAFMPIFVPTRICLPLLHSVLHKCALVSVLVQITCANISCSEFSLQFHHGDWNCNRCLKEHWLNPVTRIWDRKKWAWNSVSL